MKAIEKMFLGEPTPYDGPRVRLQVVGVGGQPEELTAGSESPSPRFVVGRRFFEDWAGEVHWFDGIFLLRLAEGAAGVDVFTEVVQSAFPDGTMWPSTHRRRWLASTTPLGPRPPRWRCWQRSVLVTGALGSKPGGRCAWPVADTELRALAAIGFDRRQLAAARAGAASVPIGWGWRSRRAGRGVVVRVPQRPCRSGGTLAWVSWWMRWCSLAGAISVTVCALVAALVLGRRDRAHGPDPSCGATLPVGPSLRWRRR